ncbi:MAG: hypothetical protein ACPGVT_05305 [Maricaulaceae bacterium]
MSFISHLCLGLAVLGLSGCMTLQNKNVAKDFDCPAQEGFGCKSIETIRSMIVTSGTPQQPIYNVSGPDVSVSGVPKWVPDVVLKVHLGDYIDAHGNFHDESVIYVVARQGGWETER